MMEECGINFDSQYSWKKTDVVIHIFYPKARKTETDGSFGLANQPD